MVEWKSGKPWPLPWPDAARSSTHDLIQSVWVSDTRRRTHIAEWHRVEHPNKPTLKLPADYPPETEPEREIRVPYVD